MAVLIILAIVGIPAIVGFCSGLTTNNITVDRSPSMNSKNDNHLNFESEHEISSWPSFTLSQPTSIDEDVVIDQQAESIKPEVSSLTPEVETGLMKLLGEIGAEMDKDATSTPLEAYDGSDAAGFKMNTVSIEDHDIDRMLETLRDADVPPPIADNLIEFPGQNSPLPKKEYSAIRKRYGEVFADQITTTPSIGATNNEIDVMMGRVSFSEDGTMFLTYNNASIQIRGLGLTEELEGEVILVNGFFIDDNAFMVEEIVQLKETKKEVL
ncbi:hypothetical protein ABER99_20545 [Paenibacillus glucanolyticus]|uniref:Uncharacterized protein n=1 Tax=Paenibacillus glucanolyticus TaxID=59843 RepID=A0A168EX22_9BACL|nr:hypothetical protein [Paenibacillus glucanolyticus]KZS44905.1 hypothetical protein AWU65_02670 [Paenibacillus glucanolyticus]OMF65546.1 hypothetical protein BK142_30510 [Paenibacillus glucanolyticus]